MKWEENFVTRRAQEVEQVRWDSEILFGTSVLSVVNVNGTDDADIKGYAR